MVSHDVYFALKDNSAAAKQKMVDACKKHLTQHPGEVFFAAGTLAEELRREVNDRDFDVALHIVFKDMAEHDAYQENTRHKQFIAENKDNWKKGAHLRLHRQPIASSSVHAAPLHGSDGDAVADWLATEGLQSTDVFAKVRRIFTAIDSVGAGAVPAQCPGRSRSRAI